MKTMTKTEKRRRLADLKLLLASIAAYHEKFYLAQALRFDDISLDGEDCPLCQVYVLQNDSCKGCPIAEFSLKPQCRATPYYKLRDRLWQFQTKIFDRSFVKFMESVLEETKDIEACLLEEISFLVDTFFFFLENYHAQNASC